MCIRIGTKLHSLSKELKEQDSRQYHLRSTLQDMAGDKQTSRTGWPLTFPLHPVAGFTLISCFFIIHNVVPSYS
ncbi:unnamed protein product [Musa acuminata subsp. burmannicoides]